MTILELSRGDDGGASVQLSKAWKPFKWLTVVAGELLE